MVASNGKDGPVTTSSRSHLQIEAWGITDVGMKRRHNEDVFLVDPDAGLFLVADGMGGHAAGEVASQLAADGIHKALVEKEFEPGETWPEHWDPQLTALGNLLNDAVLRAHQEVTVAVEENPTLKGMGTTVVAAIRQEDKDRLVIGHVGDSRAYRLRDGQLTLLTNDHSWVHEQVSAGLLTEEAARSHPLKNVVTQALGGSAEPQADVFETSMREGDLYLLCSDGLNTMITDGEIEEIVSQGGSLKTIGQRLVIAANERGGNDNVTVLLILVLVTHPSGN